MTDIPNADIDTMVAGPALNARVAERVMGWKIHPRNTVHWMRADADIVGYKVQGWTSGTDAWSPSTDWSAAGEVLERMRVLGFEVSLDDDSCGGAPHWRAVFTKNGNRYEYIRTKILDSYDVKIKSPLPLAICLAALKAIG